MLFTGTVSAEVNFTTSDDGQTMTINDAPEMQVIAIAKTVVVKGNAKEVFTWGGDIVVEGRVTGDVASFGGSVIQKSSGYIGGDVIVIGGSYRSEAEEPLREAGRQTVVFGVFEEELRSFAQDPSQMFAPDLSTSFLVQRLISIIFWFVITILFATIAPGALSRSSVKVQLMPLKVIGLGFVGLVLVVAFSIAVLGLLPESVSSIAALMSFLFVFLAYGFGRIVIHLMVGKLVQRRFRSVLGSSNAVAVLIGVVFMTLLISIPYLWPLVVVAFFAAGLGLMFTSRMDVSAGPS